MPRRELIGGGIESCAGFRYNGIRRTNGTREDDDRRKGVFEKTVRAGGDGSVRLSENGRRISV